MELIRQLLERTGWIAPGVAFDATPLGGGITNRNFRLQIDSSAYVLRIAGENTRRLGIDRQHEFHNQRVAAQSGVAPEVIAFLESEGVLLTRFVEGGKPDPGHLRDPGILESVTKSLRAIHEGPRFLGTFCPFATIDSYLHVALEHGITLPPDLARLDRLSAEIRGALDDCRPLARHPIHADLLTDNLLLSGSRVWILDWEYSGMGDVFFDLANFSDHHDFTEADEAHLLEKYFGSYQEQDHARLKLMRIMSNGREAMWGVAQCALSQLDFDFAGYARRFAARLAIQAADSRYADWLKAAGRAGSSMRRSNAQ